jgi:hypothetical protein
MKRSLRIHPSYLPRLEPIIAVCQYITCWPPILEYREPYIASVCRGSTRCGVAVAVGIVNSVYEVAVVLSGNCVFRSWHAHTHVTQRAQPAFPSPRQASWRCPERELLLSMAMDGFLPSAFSVSNLLTLLAFRLRTTSHDHSRQRCERAHAHACPQHDCRDEVYM